MGARANWAPTRIVTPPAYDAAVTLTTEVVRYGPEAVARLHHHITAAQRDDPLAVVTVVVARPTVGLALRRRLAGEAPGLVNVSFATLAQLADDMGGPTLMAAGRQPASPAVVRAAVRATLAAVADGPFRSVRFHPATERAVAGVVHDLQGSDAATRRRLAQLGSRPAAVVELVAQVEARLAGWYDEAAAVAAALEAVDGFDPAEARRRLPARVVVHLPAAIGDGPRRLLAALGRRTTVTVLLGATGDPEADEPTVALGAALDATAAPPTLPTGAPARAGQVLSAPSAEAEVLLTLRGVMQRLHDGVPLERMAVVHGGTDPYPRLLHESFTSAGIPLNGAGVRPLSATMVGRTLLGALDVADHGWRRDEVIAWLSGAPIRLGTSDHAGATAATVPATQWDDRSRRAGITAGYDLWLDHLDRHAAELTAELELLADDDDETEARRRRRRRALDQTAELRDFLVELATWLAPEDPAETWSGWAGWAERFLRRYLRPASWWPDDEVQALTDIADGLARLRVLDEVDPGPDAARFRRALETDLDQPAPSTRRFGHGVLVGPVDAVVGLDLDAVFVVGMTDGAFPARVRDDALLGDDERAAASPELPRRADRGLQAKRTYLAALAAAPDRTISYARGDQRRGREQRPSRWLLESLGALAGRRLFSRDVEHLGPVEGFRWVPSMTAAVRAQVEPASPADHDRRDLLVWFDRHGHLDGHPLTRADPVLRLGLAARHDRRRPGFTRYDGRVARIAAPSPVERGALAPTSLEHYATCPRRYFFDSVLRIDVPQRPEDVQRISPMDRGNLVHEVLERFIDEQVARPRAERIRPDQPWSAADRARLDVITDEVVDWFEQQGLTGRALLWELDQVSIRRDLHAFLDADDAYRAQAGVVPERAELRFRPDDGTPVVVELSAGRRLQFKGSADRVDLADDGAIVVLDYKTGSDRSFRDIDDADPTVRGTKLQLPVYGLAARSRFGSGPVRAEYWFVSQARNFARIGYTLDAQHLERFTRSLEVIVDGIESGAFPGRPGAEDTRFNSFANCTYCDFDPICPTDRDREWGQVRDAPELAGYVALAEPPDVPTDLSVERPVEVTP